MFGSIKLNTKINNSLSLKLNNQSLKYNFSESLNNFNTDFIIEDNQFIDNGPSNWVVTSENEVNFITQDGTLGLDSEGVKFFSKLHYFPPSTSILLNKSFPVKKIFFFSSEFLASENISNKGVVFINLNFINKKNSESVIKFVLELNNKINKIRLSSLVDNEDNQQFKVIGEINCEKLISINGSCTTYKLNERNRIDISVTDNNIDSSKLSLKNVKIKILINNKIIYLQRLYSKLLEHLNSNIIDDITFYNDLEINFSFGILDVEKIDIYQFQIESDSKLNHSGNNIESNKALFHKVEKEKNKESNFDYEKENTLNEVNNLSKPNIDKKLEDSFIGDCEKLSKDKSICKYIDKIAKKFSFNLKVKSDSNKLKEYVKVNCMKKMNTNNICNNIYDSVSSLLSKMSNDDSKVDNKLEKSESNKLEVKEMINSCNLDFFSKLVTKNSLCLNDLYNEEIITRINHKATIKDDSCLKNFCKSCCGSNKNCYICKRI
jgi:hypothetical protein